MHKEETNNQKENTKGLTMPKAIIVAGILIAGAILFPHLSGGKQAALDAAAERGVAGDGDSVTLINDVNKDDYSTGAKNPKITIVEFSDFGCSFCAQFHPTLASVVEEYPEDIAWVYRHLPYRNVKAARAAECVGQKLGDEAFWEYSDILFSSFPNITDSLMETEALRLGFDSLEKFWSCQTDESVVEAVERDAAEARLLGASGTPFSLIVTEDGRTFPLRGATQLEQLKQIIDVLVN